MGSNPTLSAKSRNSIAFQGIVKVSDGSDNSDKSTSVVLLADAQTTDEMKKPGFLPPRFHNGNRADLCYVDFYSVNPETGLLERSKKTEGFCKCNTPEEWIAHGDFLVKKYTSLLEADWSPFVDRRRIIKDHLAYEKDLNKVDGYNITYFVNLYFEHKKPPVLRKKSYKTYQSKARYFKKWLLENNLQELPVAQFTKEHAKLFLDNLRTKPVKKKIKNIVTEKPIENKTYNSYLTFLHGVWIWLDEYDEKLLEQKNPWGKFQTLPVSIKPKKTYTPEQRKFIFSHLLENKEYLLWIICRLIYKVYLRPGLETHELQIEDLSFGENKIWVPGDISKNKKTQSIPIPAEVMRALEEMKIHSYPEHFYIFGKTGPSEKPIYRDYWSKRFTKIFRALGIPPGLTIYSFKHTGNKEAHENGMPPEKQRELNRHHSLDEVMHYLAGMKIESSEELDKYYSD